MVRRASFIDEMEKMAQPAHPSHKPFPKPEPYAGPTEYSKRVSKEILARVKDVGNEKPSREWAKKILDRHKGGEHVSTYALQCALEAAGDWPAPRVEHEREPGED